jgi:hypothetical protein
LKKISTNALLKKKFKKSRGVVGPRRALGPIKQQPARKPVFFLSLMGRMSKKK